MVATTFAQALNAFDPERALRTEEELSDYFVQRVRSPLQELALLLTNTAQPQKVLFTGHRGSGKSTELAKLASLLKGQFFIVNYSVKSGLNLFDLNYVDVILSLAIELFRSATERKVKVREELLSYVYDWFTKEVTKETGIEAKGEADVGAALNAFVIKLESKVGTEASTRRMVRERVEPRLADLLEKVDLMIAEVQQKTKRPVLVIVEDLDKTDLTRARDLFFGHGMSLTQPRCSVIYTFPVALRHDNDFIQIRQNFVDPCILPNFGVARRDGSPDRQGLAKLKEIVLKRARAELFTRNALLALTQLSGGLPRKAWSLNLNWATRATWQSSFTSWEGWLKAREIMLLLPITTWRA